MCHVYDASRLRVCVLSCVHWLFELCAVYFVISMESGSPGNHVFALGSVSGVSSQPSGAEQPELAPFQSCFALAGSFAASHLHQRRRASTLPWKQGATFRVTDGSAQQSAESSTAQPMPSPVGRRVGYPPSYNNREATGLVHRPGVLDNGSFQSVFLPENMTGYVASLPLTQGIC
jgi:hypothetical protein